MLVALVFFDGATRARLLGLIAPLAAAYALAMLAVAPYLYYLFALGFPHAPIWSPAKFTADLLNFFIPTEANFLGTFGFAQAISAKFTGDLYENGVYIGIPLLILIEVYRRSAWLTAIGKFLIVTLGVAVVASFGPVLRIAGRPLFPMPWALVANLPVISNAIAARFSMYAALVTSLIAAIWFTSASARTSTKIVAALLVVVFLAPNPSALFWTRPLALPVFFADQTLLRTLKPREVLLPIPYGERGDCMYWQERTDMYFRMASGWTGITPSEFEQMPIVNFFYGETDLVEPGDQLKAFIARFAVTAIVADPSYERFTIFGPALASLGVAAEPVGGVLIYKIPPGKFAAYAKLTGAELEARALALRFDSILAATASYIAAGNDPLKLSALELQRLNLLPHDWRIDTAKNSLTGWSIGYLPDKRIAVAMYGFDQGLKPLLERYSGKVSELLYPAPSRWNPRSAPVDDRSGTALIIFDPAQFEAAVGQLRSSPPHEMTTPFLGADFR